MAAWGVGRMAEPRSASPVLRALLRRGLTRQLSPEHLLGAWSGARHRGWESRVSRTLARAPPPPPPPSPRSSFFPQCSPGLICPPLPALGCSSHGLPSSGLPALQVGWVQAFEVAGTARAHPESVVDSLGFWERCSQEAPRPLLWRL